MSDPDLFFVVPHYRLREVGETIKQYDGRRHRCD